MISFPNHSAVLCDAPSLPPLLQLCNESKLCSNCARKFVLSYDPKPSYLRLCDKCCDKVSRGNQLNNSSAKLSKRKYKNSSMWASLFGRSSKKQPPPPPSVEQSQINNNALKDQAPLFPENYLLSTPKRKEKLNAIFQRDHDQHPDLSPLAMAPRSRASDDEEEDNYYLTMHPLNNVKLRAPQSILSAKPNQA